MRRRGGDRAGAIMVAMRIIKRVRAETQEGDPVRPQDIKGTGEGKSIISRHMAALFALGHATRLEGRRGYYAITETFRVSDKAAEELADMFLRHNRERVARRKAS